MQGLGQAGDVWRCSDIPTEHDLEVLLWVPKHEKDAERGRKHAEHGREYVEQILFTKRM